MKLFYCLHCGNVVAFNIHDIDKHQLQLPEDRECIVCYAKCSYLPLDIPEVQA